MFRFFRFKESGGENLIPETKLISTTVRNLNEREAKILQLESTELACEMVRVRSLEGTETILEHVIQPLSIFPGIDKEKNIPNSLYSFYQEKYSISIVSVEEELKAVTLNSDQAKLLGVEKDEPALMVERSSINIDGRVVEWSQAICRTDLSLIHI